ncbi:hypothetical protein J3B02_003839 [Coemansia erecta]|nr:hypothetical protein J3B02_003839 [Coemansia erecta]
MRAPTEHPEADGWKELLSVSDSERIEDVEVFEKHIVVSIKRQGLPAVIVYNRPLGSRAEIRLPYNGYCTVRPEPCPQYNASTVRLSFSSPVHLESVAEYNLDSLKMCNSWSATPLHIDSNDFVIRQVRVPNGNVLVPMTLIHPEAAYWSQKTSPTLIRIYGAYGVSLEPEFRLEDVPLLRRGWTIALAHVRGGGELGRQWYADGKCLNKQNSVSDLLACSRYLLEKNWSVTSKLALTGASAGGLVVGAALNAEPNYFRAATLHVPFVDPLSSMLDPDLPLTGVEVSEWGNPLASSQDYDNISSYAPYDNIESLGSNNKPMPSILVTAGGQDKRVSVWQPAKWVARLRSKAGYAGHNGSSKLLFLASADAGHFYSHGNNGNHSRDRDRDRITESHDDYGYIHAHALRNAFLITETNS